MFSSKVAVQKAAQPLFLVKCPDWSRTDKGCRWSSGAAASIFTWLRLRHRSSDIQRGPPNSPIKTTHKKNTKSLECPQSLFQLSLLPFKEASYGLAFLTHFFHLSQSSLLPYLGSTSDACGSSNGSPDLPEPNATIASYQCGTFEWQL